MAASAGTVTCTLWPLSLWRSEWTGAAKVRAFVFSGVSSALSRSDASRYFLGTAMLAGWSHGASGEAAGGAHEVVLGRVVT